MTKKVPKSINSTRRIILGLILLFTCSFGLHAQQTIKVGVILAYSGQFGDGSTSQSFKAAFNVSF